MDIDVGDNLISFCQAEPLKAAYDRFKHLDAVLGAAGDSDGTDNTDPWHMTARDLWKAIKESLGIDG